MLDPSPKTQCLIAAVLALFLVVTRSPQVPGSALLHSGSWAVFFVAGAYLRPALALPGLLALAFAIDASAFGWAGISRYCLTPAYAMLVPAYGCLWAAGRDYAGVHRRAWTSLPLLAVAAGAGALGCELFASGGFYWFSGRFADPGLGGFLAREAQYFPAYLATLYFWVAVAAIAHVAAVTTRAATAERAA